VQGKRALFLELSWGRCLAASHEFGDGAVVVRPSNPHKVRRGFWVQQSAGLHFGVAR